jgi:hypothetical protein
MKSSLGTRCKKAAAASNDNKTINSIADSMLVKQSSASTTNLYNEQNINQLRSLITIGLARAYQSYADRMRSEPKFKYLIDFVNKRARIQLIDFLIKIKFDPSNFNKSEVKGKLTEFYVLNDKKLIRLIKTRFAMAIVSIGISTEVKNIYGKLFDQTIFFDLEEIFSGGGLKTLNGMIEIATDFWAKNEIQPSGKQFVDFGAIIFSKNRDSILISPNEIKEPTAAREIAEQMSRFKERLRSNDEITFVVNGKKETIKTTNVFFVDGEGVGIARRKLESGTPRFGKTVQVTHKEVESDKSLSEGVYSTEIFESINVNRMPAKDGTWHHRFSCTLKKKEFDVLKDLEKLIISIKF